MGLGGELLVFFPSLRSVFSPCFFFFLFFLPSVSPTREGDRAEREALYQTNCFTRSCSLLRIDAKCVANPWICVTVEAVILDLESIESGFVRGNGG
jgi:hypothetical protein